MSKINGDKSRFHVARKRNIKRRAQNRELLQGLAATAGTLTAKKPSEIPAAKAK